MSVVDLKGSIAEEISLACEGEAIVEHLQSSGYKSINPWNGGRVESENTLTDYECLASVEMGLWWSAYSTLYIVRVQSSFTQMKAPR